MTVTMVLAAIRSAFVQRRQSLTRSRMGCHQASDTAEKCADQPGSFEGNNARTWLTNDCQPDASFDGL
jgi:hypothetical protein